jgi:hypothetical protein
MHAITRRPNFLIPVVLHRQAIHCRYRIERLFGQLGGIIFGLDQAALYGEKTCHKNGYLWPYSLHALSPIR